MKYLTREDIEIRLNAARVKRAEAWQCYQDTPVNAPLHDTLDETGRTPEQAFHRWCGIEDAFSTLLRLLDQDASARYYVIAKPDVGQPSIKAFGRSWAVEDFMGRILPTDVGKRVFRVKTNDGKRDILQVENDAQRAKRQLKS